MTANQANPHQHSGHTPLVIGVTGHRDLRPGDSVILTLSVETFFRELQQCFPHTPICLLSSLAEGADCLVAKIALSVGIELIAPLPLALDDYLTDFSSESSCEEFRQLLAQAKSVLYFPEPITGTLEAGAPPASLRQRCYAQTGSYIAQNCHVLLALWNGKDNHNHGGTAQIVRYYLSGMMTWLPSDEPIAPSLQIPRPTYVCHVLTPRQSDQDTNEIGRETGARYWIAQAEATTSDAESERTFQAWRADLQKIEEFNQALEQLQVRWGKDNTPCDDWAQAAPQALHDIDLARRFHAADRLAQHYQKMTLGCARLIHVSAVAMVLFFLLYLNLVKTPVMLAGYLSTFALTMGSLFYVKSKKFQNHYFESRALAECLRIQYFWQILAAVSPAKSGDLRTRDSVRNHFLTTYTKETAWLQQALIHIADIKSSSHDAQLCEDARTFLYTHWIQDQGIYFAKSAQRLYKKIQITNKISFGLLLMTWLVGAYFIVFHYFLDLPGTIRPLLLFTLAYCPTLIAAIKGYAHTMAFEENYHRYQAAAELYQRAKIQIATAKTSDSKNEILHQLGKHALQETEVWLHLHQQRPIVSPS